MPDQILEHDFDVYFLKFRNQTVRDQYKKGSFKEHCPVEECNLGLQ